MHFLKLKIGLKSDNSLSNLPVRTLNIQQPPSLVGAGQVQPESSGKCPLPGSDVDVSHPEKIKLFSKYLITKKAT